MGLLYASHICRLVLHSDDNVVFFFKQKTAYEMRISDWSSDVCSSDLKGCPISFLGPPEGLARFPAGVLEIEADVAQQVVRQPLQAVAVAQAALPGRQRPGGRQQQPDEAAAEDRKSTRLNSSH